MVFHIAERYLILCSLVDGLHMILKLTFALFMKKTNALILSLTLEKPGLN